MTIEALIQETNGVFYATNRGRDLAGLEPQNFADQLSGLTASTEALSAQIIDGQIPPAEWQVKEHDLQITIRNLDRIADLACAHNPGDGDPLAQATKTLAAAMEQTALPEPEPEPELDAEPDPDSEVE